MSTAALEAIDLHYQSEWWQERTGIAQLTQVLFVNQKTDFVMLAFYGDGSGEHGGGSMVVAGYMGETSYFLDLESAWCEELRRAPSIDYFKASECVPEACILKGQFDGWSIQEAESKRLRLAEIVNRHATGLVALSSSVTWEDYRSVVGNGVFHGVFYHPYFFCFHGIASLAVQYKDTCFSRFRTRVAFVLDTESNKNVDVDAEQQYRLMRDRLPSEIGRKMGSTTWDTDIQFPLLQVADMLAWSVRADYAGFNSPSLPLLRDRKRLAGDARKNINAAALKQLIQRQEDQLSSP